MLKKALEKKGHQVFLVTVNPDNMKFVYEDNGKTIKLPGLPVGIYDYRLSGIYPIRVVNKIKKWKLDVIHSHTEFGVGTFARLISKQLNIPLVHTYHTMYEDYVHYITHGYFNKSSKKLVEYLTLFYCDTTANELIVPTKKTWDLFKDKYRLDKNIYIIPTGIEIERFYKEKIKKDSVVEVRKQLGLNDNDFVLLFVGRLGKEKNVDFLIEAQKDLIAKIPNAKLVIIGDGPERDNLYKQITHLGLENHIFLLGKKSKNDIVSILAKSHAFILPSRGENFSVAIIEALSIGIPVVATDCGGTKESINNSNGILVPVDDTSSMSESLLYMFNNILKYNASDIRKNSKERYSSSVIGNQLLAIFDNVLYRKDNCGC